MGLPYQEFRLRYVHALSGGQRRRVAIAGVLAMRTPVLVLDEPTAGLDPRGRRELLDLLRRLADDRDLTLVVCSASLGDASLLCDRIVVLDDGRVVVDGPLREVLAEDDRLAALDITLPETAAAAQRAQEALPRPAGLPADGGGARARSCSTRLGRGVVLELQRNVVFGQFVDTGSSVHGWTPASR